MSVPPAMALHWDIPGRKAHACQLHAILLWMHNGLGYIYGQYRFRWDEPARHAKPQGLGPKRKQI